MNKRQVIILWVIAIVLGVAVTVVKVSRNHSAQSATKRTQGQTLFESFPAADIATIEIEGADGTASITKKDGKWVIADRSNYPANKIFVNDLIRTISDLKVTLGMEAGPSFAPRFGMDETAKQPAERGLTLTFKNATTHELAKVSLGKNIETAASPSPMGGSSAVGRYVRNHADDSGFYAVSEMFPSVSADPKRWLADGFINPEKIITIAVSAPGKSEPSWKLSRATEDAEFVLEGATPEEVLDATATAPLKSLFSYARFEDVVPADQVAERAVAEGKQTAIITTAEGFTYTVQIFPAKAVANAVATGETLLLTVDVAAEIPKVRKKEADEKPEDAKTKDAAFTERQKALTEKLAKEQAFAGVTFVVAKSLVEPLLKDRKTLTTAAKPEPAPGADNGSVQQLPGGMIARPPISATTPPISVPMEGEE